MSFGYPYFGEGFDTGGAIGFQTMIWNPENIGGRDDSFATGWSATNVTLTKIDGDYCEMEISAGQTEGYIEKTGISVASATYPYLILRVKGDDEYYVELYYANGWNRLGPFKAHHDYRFETLYLPDYGVSGTITGIRLGVRGAAGDKAWYDFYEMSSVEPEYTDDLTSLLVLQKELEADTFNLLWRIPAVTECWVSPTGYEDPDTVWSSEENTYDEDTNTAGQCSVPADSWSSPIILTIDSITSNKLRFYAYYNAASINQVDVDVYRDGEWVDVYQGSFADREWVEKTFTKGKVTEARVRFYNDGIQQSCSFYEFDFWEATPNPFIKGLNIRIVAGRDDNWEKLFAGVVEEFNLMSGGLREVRGRCFQLKLQAATKSKTFDDRELSLAVKDLVEDFDEITTDRVKTPSPSINVTKDYVDSHISDALDQLASLPSKQSPYEAWRWKLGYGQDLRFRSDLDTDVLMCGTEIVEGTNILAGVKKGSDIYELFNRVKALSGLVESPLDDDWCESTTDWTVDSDEGDATLSTSSSAGYVRRGTYGMVLDIPNTGNSWAWAKRALAAATDYSEYGRLVLDFLTGSAFVGTTSLEVRCYSQGGGHFYYEVIGPNENRPDGTWWHRELDLDDPAWQTSGSPSWEDIDEIEIRAVIGKAWGGVIRFDGVHFEADNLERTATDTLSTVDHDRIFVYKDAKINDPAKLKDLADGLLEVMRAAADRIMLPVIGAPDLQRGRKVTATSTTFELGGVYVIAEAEHIINRSVGYVTTVLLDRGRYALPADLKRTLERELRLEKLGTVTIS